MSKQPMPSLLGAAKIYCGGLAAAATLQRAGGNLKKAMLILQGCTPDEAAALLEQASGRLRTALRLAGSASEIASEMPTVDADIASAMPDKVAGN